nr:hypothetical protein [Tanacetum cinerariifolium]
EIGKKPGRTVTLNTEDMQKKKNDVKARTTLLLFLPDEHQLRFSKYKTAQELWAAILKTFGGNEATKKTKKNLLKQQYGNFKAEGIETMEKTFNRLQVIVGQLQFMDVEIEQDDLNQKFLTSLAPEWRMHTIVWRNRSDLDTMSLDDLYNHLKVYEFEVQKTLEPNSQNMAFISLAKHSSENKDSNTASFSTASTNVPTASENVATASISQETACAYIASQSSEDHALVADEEAPTEFALMANTSTESKTLKQEKEGVDGKLASLLTASKDLDNLIKSQRADKNKEGLGYSVVPPPPAQLYSSPKKDLSWTGLQKCTDDTVTDYSRDSPTMESTSGNDQNRNPSVFETVASPITPRPFVKFVKASDSPTKSKIDKAKKAKKSPVKYAERYRKTNKKPNKKGEKGTTRSQNNTYKSPTHRPIVYRPHGPPMRPMRSNMNGACPNRTSFNKPAHSYTNRPFQRKSAVRSQYRAPWVPTVNRNVPPVNRKFSTGSRNFTTANKKFPTASRKIPTGSTKFSTADMGMKGKAVKPSAYWFWKPSQNLSNKGPNNNSVLVMFKKYTYIDTQGRLKSVMAWVPKENKSFSEMCTTVPRIKLMTKAIRTVAALGT